MRDAGRSFQIQTFGQKQPRQGFVASFARERVQKNSQDILRDLQDSAMARSSNRATRDINPGESRWYVATMGLPGQEKVISVAREEWFEAGRLPTISSVEQALVAKYGMPTHRIDRGTQESHLTWAHDLQVGNWFMLDHNNRPTQVQFVWRSDRKQLHLFAAPGGRSFLIQAGRLASYLQAGLLVPAEEETLTARATREALAKLDANPERLLD